MKVTITNETNEEMTEEEFDKRLTDSYNVGVSVGLKEAADYLLMEAVSYFKNDKDKEATMIRLLSETLSKRAKDAHPRKDKS